jgi:outer membrane protein TolC
MRAIEARGCGMTERAAGDGLLASAGVDRHHPLPRHWAKRWNLGVLGAAWVLLSPTLHAETPASSAPAATAAAPALPAQGVQSLRLAPIDLAHMLALRSLELAYGRESVQVAALLAEAERALYEPVLFMSARVGDTQRQRTVDEVTSSFTSAGEKLLKEETESLEVGVRQRVPSGGELALSARQSRRSSNILAKANTELEVSSGLVLTFKQPLMRGRGRQITETDRRVAEIEAVVTQWQFRQQLQKVMAEGLSVFWQAQVASEAVRLRQALQRSAEAMLADAEERLAAGRLAPRLVSEARRLLLQRQSETLRAQLGRDELLLRLLSSVDLPHQRLGDLQLVAQPTPALSLMPVIDDRQALAQWAPYRIAALRQEQGHVRLVFALNQQRPAVDLVLSHTQSGLGNRLGDGSWPTARSGRYPEWYVGINAELGAYGNGRARAQAQAQAMRVQQSETEQRAIEQTFLNDLQAKREAMRALEQEQLLVQNDLAARGQFFEQEKQRVALGVAALFSQIQAEQDLLEARIRLADVSGRRETARLALLLAEGSLLEAHAVETPLPSEP